MIDHPANVVSNSSSHNSLEHMTTYVNNPLLGQPSSSKSDGEPNNQTHISTNNTDSMIMNPTSSMDSQQPSSQLILSSGPLPILPSSGLAVSSTPNNHNTVPEFLYQLTKMLTGGHNDIIEWSNGRIEVHNPYKLESMVLQKYFRHSKFASFQRQLNYFGFRKLAGKGKMAPCSYVNEAATQDIGSLLQIKRKVGPPNPRDKNGRKGGKEKRGSKAPPTSGQGVPYQTATNTAQSTNMSSPQMAPTDGSQQAIARSAVGRGVRHSFALGSSTTPASDAVAASATAGQETPSERHQQQTSNITNFTVPTGVEDSLSQLTSNFQSSLADSSNHTPDLQESQPPQDDAYGSLSNDGGFSLLSRNSSLIDLAMLPTYEEGDTVPEMPGFSFVDFPQPEVDPSQGYHEPEEPTSS